MRIDGRNAAASVAAAAAAGAKAEAGRPAFSVGTERAGQAGGARSAAPLATLDAILALQGEDGTAERRRRSARRAQDLLDGLDHLKAALLSGRVAPGDLRALADRLKAGAGPSGDPGLDEVVAAVELRARVELAKLGMS